MKKSNVLAILIMLLCSVMLFGCNSSGEKKESKTVDKEFIETLQGALQKRWDLADNSDKKVQDLKGTELKDAYESFIDVELDGIEKYKDETFEDSKLQEKAIQYINTLNDMKSSLDYLTVDFIRCSELYNKGDKERSKLISIFVNDYGLKVDEKYQSVLDDFLTKANKVNDEENEKSKIENFTASIQFQKTEDDYGFKKYEAVVENNLGIDFKHFSISINLLDKDGVIVDTTYAGVENWDKGQKVKFDFGTDKEFASTKATADYIKK